MCAFFLVQVVPKMIFLYSFNVFLATMKPVHITRTKFRLCMAVPNDRSLLRNDNVNEQPGEIRYFFAYPAMWFAGKLHSMNFRSGRQLYVSTAFQVSNYRNHYCTPLIRARTEANENSLFPAPLHCFCFHWFHAVDHIVRMHAKMQHTHEANRHIPAHHLHMYMSTF